MATTQRHATSTALGCALAISVYAVVSAGTVDRETPSSPLQLASSRVSIAGTSNIHAYTASTTAARIVRLELAKGALGANCWEEIARPGAVELFEISIPAATLSSPREGLDKNMHKALKVAAHPDITFSLSRLETGTRANAFRAVGTLKVAGVEREVVIDLKTRQTEMTLVISGEVQLLMTDFGITPPKAMLGMLKTDPKITVSFETVFTTPLT